MSKPNSLRPTVEPLLVPNIIIKSCDQYQRSIPSGGRASHSGSTPLWQQSLTPGDFHLCSAASHRPNAASPPKKNTQQQGIWHPPGRCCTASDISTAGRMNCFRNRTKISFFSFEAPLTGIFNRKSSWLKRKPRSVLEDGLGVELNKPVGRSTKTKCRFPGNEVWKNRNNIVLQTFYTASVGKSCTGTAVILTQVQHFIILTPGLVGIFSTFFNKPSLRPTCWKSIHVTKKL